MEMTELEGVETTSVAAITRGYDQCRQCQELVFTRNPARDTKKQRCQSCHYEYCQQHLQINDKAGKLTNGHRCDYRVQIQCGYCQENIQATYAWLDVFCRCRAVKIFCTQDVKDGVCQTVDSVYWMHIKPNPANTASWYDTPVYAHPVTEETRFCGGIYAPEKS